MKTHSLHIIPKHGHKPSRVYHSLCTPLTFFGFPGFFKHAVKGGQCKRGVLRAPPK